MQPHVRIISGKWKRKKIPYRVSQAIRPTPDRVKETLFNWIAHRVHDAKVLDLFAGTGSLGFECLSRGARSVTFIERDTSRAMALRRMCSSLDLDADAATVQRRDATRWLREPGETRYDIVFIDPPFAEYTLYENTLSLLVPHLASNAAVYVEHDKRLALPLSPFQIDKSSTVGDVAFRLMSQT